MAGESAGAFKSIAAFGRKTGAAPTPTPTAHRLNALPPARSAAASTGHTERRAAAERLSR